MRHGVVSTGRELAAFQAAMPANDAMGREFIVAVQHQGEAMGYHKTVAVNGVEAYFRYREKFPAAVRIEVSELDGDVAQMGHVFAPEGWRL